MTTPTARAASRFPSMVDPVLAAAKAAARAEAMARRTGFDPALGGRLAAIVLAESPPPQGAIVSGFWPIGDEIDLRPLLIALHARGHRLCLPETVKRGNPLIFRRWQPGDRLIPGRFGTSHPDSETLTPDFLLVPLLAFDRTGHRLGYGAGYYDRTLAALPHAFRLGCAYAAQEIPEVPAGPNDVRLHAIATEQALIRAMAESPRFG